MKLHTVAVGIVMVMMVSLLSGTSLAPRREGSPSIAPDASAKTYLGRWDLVLEAPDQVYPSWLELSDEGGTLKARMVGRWGHAHALNNVEISNGRLTFASPKEEEETLSDIKFEGKLTGNTLAGTVTGLKGGTWRSGLLDWAV